MAKKPTAEPPQPEPELRVPPAEAAQKLDERILKGGELLKREIRDAPEIDNLGDDFQKWSAYNTDLLGRLFTTAKLANEYSYWGGGVIKMHPPSHAERLHDLKKGISEKIKRLE